MGPPGNRDASRTHSLFVDDLKVYQESHEILRDVNDVIVQASPDNRACYGVSKCAEIVFERGKTVGEKDYVFQNKEWKTQIDADENDIFKLWGIEQADGIKTNKVFERLKDEVNKRVKMLTNTELNDMNSIPSIDIKVTPVAAYPINICKFTDRELKELDQVIKHELRSKNMLGKQ